MTKVWRWNPERRQHEMREEPSGKFKFTDEDRIAIVSEYVNGHVPASKIIEKYHLSSRQILFNWMDKFVNEKELVSLPDETNPTDPMAKKSPEDRVKELEAENKKLQKASSPSNSAGSAPSTSSTAAATIVSANQSSLALKPYPVK